MPLLIKVLIDSLYFNTESKCQVKYLSIMNTFCVEANKRKKKREKEKGGEELMKVEIYRYKLRGSRQSCLLYGAIRTTPRSRGL